MKRFSFWLPYVVLSGLVLYVVVANLPDGSTARTVATGSSVVCPPCGMQIDPASALQLTRDGRPVYFCGASCRDRFQSSGETSPQESPVAGSRYVDVVCHMEVNKNWGIVSQYKGTAYHFCNERCRDQFAENPSHYLADRCLVCQTVIEDQAGINATYLGKTYSLCSAQHRRDFKADPAAFFMHTMWGIPSWLYYTSIALVLIVSFGVFERLAGGSNQTTPDTSSTKPAKVIGRNQIRGEGERLVGGSAFEGSTSTRAIALPILTHATAQMPARIAGTCAARSDRFDLLSILWIKSAVCSRPFRFVLQAIVVALFVMIVVAGLIGNQNPALNIAPILTWTVWWGALIILILFAGKSWCYVCPWDAVAGWTEKLAFWKKKNDGLSLGYKWPRIVRNVLIATILFVGLTWVELGFGVTMKPRITAYLAIAMLLMAVVSAMLFDRKSFCRYGCLVGRVSGLYALFSSTEIRAKSQTVCKGCDTKECVTGSDTAYGCPTFLYPGKMDTNTYCIQCMECIQACPHDNLALNLRPWGSDLAHQGKPRADEAYLALLMLSITGFHGLTMTPVWAQLIDGIRNTANVGRVIGFSVGMALIMLGPIAIYGGLVAISQRLGRSHTTQPMAYRDYFVQYAYAMLPIALFYHIAHNLEHLLMEGPKVVTMMSDPLGWGWNVLGTANWSIPPLISLDRLWLVQVFLVLLGHVYSLWIARKTSLRVFGNTKSAFRSQLPMLAGMIVFSVFSLWLLKQPMEMRTSAM